MKDDMAAKLKTLQYESAERQHFAFSKEGEPDDKMILSAEDTNRQRTYP